MLTQLATVKARLALDPIDLTYDALLQRAIAAISARFDQETNRTLARAENATCEFPARDTVIFVARYPIEQVAGFALKFSESEGWLEQTGVECLIRSGCVIALENALGSGGSGSALARVSYTGGYVLPGDPDPVALSGGAPPQRLPAELEQAAVEQTAFWFQTRDQLGVLREWPKGGNYVQFADSDLLPAVREVLRRYTRFVV